MRSRSALFILVLLAVDAIATTSNLGEPLLMTNSNGNPVYDNDNSITAGPNGPILISDFNLIDKLSDFNRERVPERVVHAKGAGAYGVFTVTKDITKYTRASLFSKVGKQTQVIVRFSTVGGEMGSADTARDPRGFAVKFYTDEGNWDLVGNNTPVFFIRDPIKFPDFVHTQKRDPRTHLKNHNNFWDFLSLSPETVHQVTFLFSDRGTPDGYRHMNGHGSHTFRLVNDKNEFFFVKFHWKTGSGIQNLSASQAEQLAGSNPDYATEDLYNSIEAGNFPDWTMYAQIMPEAEAATYTWNVFDVTKLWPVKDYPLIEVGRMILNKNADNFFAEIEQAAFSPSHLVRGIQASEDKLLQGRLFAYPDAHRHRLGVNYKQIPVNCPYSTKIANGQRDGNMVTNGNQGSLVNYEPNSVGGYAPNSAFADTPISINATTAQRFPQKHPNSDFAQAGGYYRGCLDEQGRTNLVNNIVGHMTGIRQDIQIRQIKIFYQSDPDYGTRIATGLGINIDTIEGLQYDHVEVNSTCDDY